MSVNVKRILGDESYTVIDAKGHILGRLSSKIAKRLINGENIVIINAEKAVITGQRSMNLNKYVEKSERGSQESGPYFPRHPESIFKRTVRGMLPWKSRRGREAFKRLKVFIDVPEELRDMQFEYIDDALMEKVSKTDRYITLGEVSKYLGSKVIA